MTLANSERVATHINWFIEPFHHTWRMPGQPANTMKECLPHATNFHTLFAFQWLYAFPNMPENVCIDSWIRVGWISLRAETRAYHGGISCQCRSSTYQLRLMHCASQMHYLWPGFLFSSLKDSRICLWAQWKGCQCLNTIFLSDQKYGQDRSGVRFFRIVESFQVITIQKKS